MCDLHNLVNLAVYIIHKINTQVCTSVRTTDLMQKLTNEMCIKKKRTKTKIALWNFSTLFFDLFKTIWIPKSAYMEIHTPQTTV